MIVMLMIVAGPVDKHIVMVPMPYQWSDGDVIICEEVR